MSDALATYLYDHLCGATSATEVLHALRESHQGKPLELFVVPLLAEAEADHQLLALMSQKLGVTFSSSRKQLLVENAVLIRRGIKDKGESGLLSALQYLAMVMEAKASLWKLLEAAPDERLVGYDFEQLAIRAQMQHKAVKQRWGELLGAHSENYRVARTMKGLLQLVRWLGREVMRSQEKWKVSRELVRVPEGEVRTGRFAALVLVGPSEADLQGLQDLVDSLTCYEAKMQWLVIIDDYESSRNLTSCVVVPQSCGKVSLHKPRKGVSNPRLGGLCSNVLAGLLWLFEHAAPEFVLKIDTDALVIAPFVNKLVAFMNGRPEAGLFGALGHTCNRSSPLFRCQLYLPSPLVAGYVARFGHLPRRAKDNYKDSTVPCDELLKVVWSEKVWSDIELSYSNGYLGLHYCQGGCYAMSATMLKRLGEGRFLNGGDDWESVPIGEDVMMGMYARAVGLGICDYSAEGQVFGIQFRALPYPPEELLLRGYSIIHSVRNDATFNEDQVRQFFKSLRSTI